MKQEIERKFLLKDDSWKNLGASGTEYKQAYLAVSMDRTVRVRIAGDRGYLTIKGPAVEGSVAHAEYEYEIPVQDAQDIFDHLCEPGKVEKTRYKIPYENHIWEIDVFHGDNEGLVMAEVELETEGEPVILPAWIGEEVSGNSHYANAMLAQNPYKNWK